MRARARNPFSGVMLPWWSTRALAVLLAVGAIGLPWLATRQGVLERDVPANGPAAERKEIQLRPELVELPGGAFLMGSPEGEKDGLASEKQHTAEVSAFAICRTEVTLGQWAAVMGTRPNDCAYGCEGDHPVQNVSWEDAVRYLNRLTDRENELDTTTIKLTKCYKEETWEWNQKCTGYRLPTEAEWEYAARAGTTTAYGLGNDPRDLCEYGNGADRAAKKKHADWTVNDACDDTFADLAPVGSFKPNPWGLFDMHGNVWEWNWDLYDAYPNNPPEDYSGPNNGSGRVLRGGSFLNVPGGLRSSLRYWLVPTLAFRYSGFRCVRGSRPSP